MASGQPAPDTSSSAPSSVTVKWGGVVVTLGSIRALPAVVGFALSSSLLAIINKYALVVFPFPALLTAMQYLTSVGVVLVLGQLRLLDHSPLTWELVCRFFPAAFVFYMSLFTNMHLLQAANVDTFIVFRSCTPLLVAIADHLFRDEPWPSVPTFASLLIIFAGAVGYVLLDKQFSITAYSWAFAYLFTITFDMVYIKHVVHSVKLNTWGLVLYNNLLAFLLFPFFFVVTGELERTNFDRVVDLEHWSLEVIAPVLASCGFGLAISFFAFACRKAVSATAFTVVGVTAKFLTVIVNTLSWDRHASAGGIFCLILTIVGGVIYQQSTVQDKSVQVPNPKPALIANHKVPAAPAAATLEGKTKQGSLDASQNKPSVPVTCAADETTSLLQAVDGGASDLEQGQAKAARKQVGAGDLAIPGGVAKPSACDAA